MRVETGIPVNNNDFFAALKTFIAGLNSFGWVIDAQNDNEIYFHNSDGYYGFKWLFVVSILVNTGHSYYDGMFSGGHNILVSMSADGYNSNVGFFNQPGCSATNINTIDRGMNNVNSLSAHTLREAVQGAIQGYLFCADENTIFVHFTKSADTYRFILITKMEKTFNWNGGRIISASEILFTSVPNNENSVSIGSEPNWNSVSDYYIRDMVTPFIVCRETKFMNYSICSAVEAAGMWHYFGTNAKDIDNTTILSNFMLNGAPITTYVPFSPNRMYFTSRYTGLSSMITPHYFIKNNENRFILAGKINKIKIVNRGNMTHLQRIWYGDRLYLIVDYSSPNLFLAFDITEES